jgi:hypothetical protein
MSGREIKTNAQESVASGFVKTIASFASPVLGAAIGFGDVLKKGKEYLDERKLNMMGPPNPNLSSSPQQDNFLVRGVQGVTNFLGNVVRPLDTALESVGIDIIPGSATGTNQKGQNVAIDIQSGGGQESGGSGVTQGFLGPLVPGVLGALRNPLVGLGTGAGAGALVDAGIGALTAPRMNRRITRKMKADIRRIYMMSGGNAQATAQMYNSLTGDNLNGQQVFMILLKRFRNDGPMVTKAAVRKTRQTMRKLKGMCDMYDDMSKRRAPTRRRATSRATTITQVK